MRKICIDDLSPKTASFIRKQCERAPIEIDPNGLVRRISWLAREINGNKKLMKAYYGYPDHVFDDILEKAQNLHQT